MHLHESIADMKAVGADSIWPHYVALLAQAYGRGDQVRQGLTLVDEVLAFVDTSGERYFEAEVFRIKGELLLNDERRTMNDERQIRQANTVKHVAEAEECFHKAIDIARKQQAKS